MLCPSLCGNVRIIYLVMRTVMVAVITMTMMMTAETFCGCFTEMDGDDIYYNTYAEKKESLFPVIDKL